MWRLILMTVLAGSLAACGVAPCYEYPFTRAQTDNSSIFDANLALPFVGNWVEDSPSPSNWISVSVVNGLLQNSNDGLLGANFLNKGDKTGDITQLPLLMVPFELDGKIFMSFGADMTRVCRDNGYNHNLMGMSRPYFYIAEVELIEDGMTLSIVNFAPKIDYCNVPVDSSVTVDKLGVVTSDALALQAALKAGHYKKVRTLQFKRATGELPKVTPPPPDLSR